MKKLILVTLLLTLILIPCLCCGVAFADTTQSGSYYYYYNEQNKGYDIPVYADFSSTTPLFYIPYSYAFVDRGASDNADYRAVTYNGYDGYIKSVDFVDCIATKTTWNSGYAYTNYVISLDKIESINIFTIGNLEDSFSTTTNIIKIDKVYGYTNYNGNYYFLVDYTLIDQPRKGYVQASQVSPDFNPDNIALNASFIEETYVETPSGDISSGDNTPSNVTPATNNLERYLLIAVIVVLCLIIVVLIFLPNKRNKNSHF